jgi:hypothetical protein
VNTNPRRGVFWPLLLIALGLVFLLQNYGLISGISWIAIASLWPLLLVLIGLDIAFARRWPLPTLAAEVLVIAGGLALAASAPNLGPGIFVFGRGDGVGVTDVTVPRGDATQLALTLNAGATRAYRVSGGASALVEGHSANPDLRLRTLGTGGATGGCVGCGSSVETSGYGAARDRVTLTISAGATSILVR